MTLNHIRISFYLGLDNRHNFHLRKYGQTRITFFVLSAARKAGNPLSAFHSDYLDGLKGAKTDRDSFSKREAFIVR